MKARSTLRREAMRFLRWRKEMRGIDFVELRGGREAGAEAILRRNARNGATGAVAGTAEVDVAFRYNERTGRGDWR